MDKEKAPGGTWTERWQDETLITEHRVLIQHFYCSLLQIQLFCCYKSTGWHCCSSQKPCGKYLCLFFTLCGFTFSDEIGASRVASGQQLPLCILAAQFPKVPAANVGKDVKSNSTRSRCTSLTPSVQVMHEVTSEVTSVFWVIAKLILTKDQKVLNCAVETFSLIRLC